jgi:hypothetical protein
MRIAASLALALAGCTPAATAPSPARPADPCPAAAAAFVPAPVTATKELAAGMARLSFMRGVWRGQASGTTAEGTHYTVTQTEHMGPMLGGDIVVVEGRGYKDDGTTGFNAFAVVSYDPRKATYEIRSYAMGFAGTFELKLTDTGYIWEVPAGPSSVVRFTATVTGDTWREVGEYVAAGKPPVPDFEMNLKRIGDTDWPLAPVSPK